jgi:hypothetical protein
MNEQDREIEELAEDYADREASRGKGEAWTYGDAKNAYKAGYRAGQQALLDKASASFGEWERKVTELNGGKFPDFVEPEYLWNDAWTAARLSLLKELGERGEIK